MELSVDISELKVLGGRLDEIKAMAAKYQERGSLVIPLLWMVQRQEGWVTPEGKQDVALVTGRTMVQIQEVVTFYTMFHQQPVGKHVVGVCRTLPCALCGAEGLGDFLKERLGIGYSETTEDSKFTLIEYECLGACSEAPLMMINETLHTKLTRAKVAEILAGLT